MEKGMSLYQISEMWIDSLEGLDCIQDEEEYKLAVEELNEQMSLIVANKAENIVKYNANINSQIEILKNEKERLDELIKRFQKKQDTMNKSIQNAMEKLELDKIETTFGNISLRTKPLSVELEEEISLNDIPEDFKKITTKVELDKTAIKDLYKTQGIKLKGIKYNEGLKSINYK